MTDEQLARMLQDELFQEELRNNPEFSHLAGRRNPRAHPSWGAGGAGAGGQTTGRSNYGGAAGGGDVGKDILEGLSSECHFETLHSWSSIFHLNPTTCLPLNSACALTFRRCDARQSSGIRPNVVFRTWPRIGMIPIGSPTSRRDPCSAVLAAAAAGLRVTQQPGGTSGEVCYRAI